MLGSQADKSLETLSFNKKGNLIWCGGMKNNCVDAWRFCQKAELRKCWTDVGMGLKSRWCSLHHIRPQFIWTVNQKCHAHIRPLLKESLHGLCLQDCHDVLRIMDAFDLRSVAPLQYTYLSQMIVFEKKDCWAEPENLTFASHAATAG